MTLLFSIPKFNKTARELVKSARLKIGQVKVDRFLSGDFYVKLKTAVKNKKCYLLGGTIDNELIQTLLLAHTLKKEGAKEIIALIPYLGYARQDKNEKGQSLGVRWEGELFKAVGIKKVIVIDLHSKEDKKLFPIPIVSINPYGILSNKIPKIFREASIVAPDYGAIDNAKELKKSLKNKQPIVYLEKKRVGENVILKKLIGKSGPKAIIVDDILDTGQTIIHVVEELKREGVRAIIVVVTHALFSGKNWQKIWKLGVQNIYCADTISLRPEVKKDKRIKVISILPILNKYFSHHLN